MSTTEPTVRRIFVSSPGDVEAERRRVDQVVERLNGEYFGVLRFEVVRWETRFYTADKSFQPQIAKSIDCDVVIGILWSRLGSPLPSEMGVDEQGDPWSSGTAYEIMTAISERRRGAHLPDVYIFRKTADITIPNNDSRAEQEILEQRRRLNNFWQRHFHSIEGEFKAAFQSFRTPDEFDDQLERLLRQWIDEAKIGYVSVPWPIQLKGSPFRGLEPFDADHSAVFFGRDRDVNRAVELLRKGNERGRPALFLIGASGSGKSSIVRAGILPFLHSPGRIAGLDGFRTAIMRPASFLRPIESLTHGLFEESALPELREGPFASPNAFAALLGHADATAVAPVVAALESIAKQRSIARDSSLSSRVDLILVIDQLEEIFTQTADEQDRFGRLLGELLATRKIWLILTLRADLYERLLAVPSFRALKQVCESMDIAAPGSAELASIVRDPARAAGIVFEEDPTSGQLLDDRILADASSEMLPLIQFTLQSLFLHRSLATDGTITFTHAAYEQLGGIDGAVDTAAEAAITGLSDEEQNLLPSIIRQMAALETTGSGDGSAVAARPLPASAVSTRAAVRLIEALVQARILLAESHETGEASYRLAHERIFSSWRRAGKVVADSREFLRRRLDAEQHYHRWMAKNRKGSFLLQPGWPLSQAKTLLKLDGELDSSLLAYIRKSARRRYVTIAGNALGSIMIVGGVALTLLIVYLESNSDTSSLIFEKSNEIANNFNKEQREKMGKLASKLVERFAQEEYDEPSASKSLALISDIDSIFDGDNEKVLSIIAKLILDGQDPVSAISEDLRSRSARRSLIWQFSFYYNHNYSYNSRDIFGVDHDLSNYYDLRSTENGSAIVKYSLMENRGKTKEFKYDTSINNLITSPDGKLLAAFTRDGSVLIIDDEGQVSKTVHLSEEPYYADLSWSPDNRHIAFRLSGSPFFRILDTATGAIQSVSMVDAIGSLGASPVLRQWSQDGLRLAIVDEVKQLRIMELDGGLTTVNCDYTWKPSGLIWAPGGSGIMMLTEPGATFCPVSASDGRSGEEERSFGGFKNYSAGAWTPDGATIALATVNGEIEIYASSSSLKTTLKGHSGPVLQIAWDKEGGRLATGGADGLVRIWDAATGSLLQSLHHPQAVEQMLWSTDGHHVLTATRGVGRVWQVGPGDNGAPVPSPEKVWLSSYDAPLPHRTIPTGGGAGPDCDRLAAHPFDPRRSVATGVISSAIIVPPALAACEQAVRSAPDEPRYRFQLGRVLTKAKRTPEAAMQFQTAMASDYPAAYAEYASAVEKGEGVPKDMEKAQMLFRKAWTKGMASAAASLGLYEWYGDTVAGRPSNTAEAIRIWKEGAAAGDPYSHSNLAVISEFGLSGESVDLPAALMHAAIATKLLDAAGVDTSTASERYQQADLARRLDDAAIVKVWPTVRDFKAVIPAQNTATETP